jgi:molybdenum cofactor guanylyltransferase
MTALILAGGRGSRMGGVDKGLERFRGVPLAQWTLQRLHQQAGRLIGEVMINANRSLPDYESLGVPVWTDASPTEFAGPLAGFLTGLERSKTPYLLVVPCDTPLFPLDLARRLHDALTVHHADIAMAAAPETDASGITRTRAQPVFVLLQASLKDSLIRFLQTGGRKIDAWTAQHHTELVPFDTAADDRRAFANANTLDELRALESIPDPSASVSPTIHLSPQTLQKR